jgi:glycosyltransferase involved in cell wall biosynthesis
LRILHLLQRIARHHDVTLGCHVWDERDREGVEALNQLGIRTVGADIWAGSLRRHALPGIVNALRGIPPETAQYQTRELHALVAKGEYDVLHVEETTLTPYARSIPAGHPGHRVLTLHNVHFVQDRRVAAIEPTRRRRIWKHLNAGWMWHYEPRVAASFDRCIAVTDDDRDALLARDPSISVEVVPNGVDTQALRPLPAHRGRPALLFVGSMAYLPCADAATWLVREILPAVRRHHPDAEVWIVGKNPPPDVLALAGPGVYVLGEVPDVVPYYARASLAVVPLRAGGGSRLKILEAMALGRAVVSTTLGAEGLNVVDGRDLLVADSAPALADAIHRLLTNDALRQSCESAARGVVEEAYDWDEVAARQLAIYNELESQAFS